MSDSLKEKKRNSVRGKKVQYAVVGMGYIAQNAVLPAFAHAGRVRKPELVAAEGPSPD
jgi:predicted dehydrogenase